MSVNTELLKNRDFRNTLFAIGANQLSDSMSYITTPIIILALTGSPEAASITLFVAGVLATCAGAISGTWVDRIGPSKCLALSCIGQSLSWVAILLYLVFNVTNIYVLVITISLAAIISTFDYPSEQSIITRVVPKEHLGYASGMGETRESTANLLGGPVAGIIIGFSTVLMTAVHAVVNLLAFIVAPKTYGASRQPAEEEEGEKTSFWQDSKAGFEYILKNKVLVSIAFVSTLANFGTVGIPLTFIYYLHPGGRTPALHWHLCERLRRGRAARFVPGRPADREVCARPARYHLPGHHVGLLPVATGGSFDAVGGVPADCAGGYCAPLLQFEHHCVH